MSTTTTAAPAPPTAAPQGEISSRRQVVVFGTIALGILLGALDQTVVSTALPTIVGDLGGSGEVAWVVTSYVLTQTIATAIAGKLGDLFGRKLVFQVSVAVFLVGSALCGLSQSLPMLIAFRALQGIGGGGLTVTATALIAEVIPLRQRGKYQGALGAVFGVTTIGGPLLGGVITDALSWRWIFYLNLPIGIAVIVLAGFTIPVAARRGRPVIDVLGTVLITIGAGSLVLATSLGGGVFPWLSVETIGLYALAAAALVAFVLAEQRAKEPILPMRLFRDRVFSVTMILSFIVGFAMLGALTYLPTYLQWVQGVNATSSGLRTLPMVAGLLVTSLLSGVLVSRTGRYKIYPVVGSAMMGVGLFLLSLLGPTSGVLVTSGAMLVLGLGIGLAMQVLTIIVQNTAQPQDLGVATSAVTFFRTMGSSIGTAIFGAIYATSLGDRLPAALRSAGLPRADTATPTALHRQPASAIRPIVDAYADTLHVVFLCAVPVAGVAFVFALLLKEVPLRGMAQSTATDVGKGYAVADGRTSDEQLEGSLGTLLQREAPTEFPRLQREAVGDVAASDVWCVMQVRLRRELDRTASVAAVARSFRMPPEVLQPAFSGALAAGYLEGTDDDLRLTDAGSEVASKLLTRVQAWVGERLGLDGTDDADRLDSAFTDLARKALDAGTVELAGPGGR